jgi:hypothetical protein
VWGSFCFLLISSLLRRLALRALSFASFSPTLSLHHILADPFSEHGVALLNTEEGRVNG